jgi:deoxyadenosine/deoxycytidine kinase
MLPDRYRYIVVEGPIGVGKTTLAGLIARRTDADLMLEDPGVNPFLRGFYRDSRRYAFATQMFFLEHRIDQVMELKQRDPPDRLTVSDFLLEKDALFARLNLDDHEYALYESFYRRLDAHGPVPDLVIYLQAPAEALIERIRRRGNAIERNISEDYLSALVEAYTQFFHRYDAAPLLIVNSENLNFVDRSRDFDLLLQCIISLRSSREFFSRG